MYVFGGYHEATRLIGGIFILVGLALSFVSRWFLIMDVLPGFWMVVSYFTGFCPTEVLLTRIGVPHRNMAEAHR
ncbi:MAG: DUF2892 domain-containing protein [Firmicutes bacterium]|nr:DUF2892 domain-containing protein [Bacillota bacterium]